MLGDCCHVKEPDYWGHFQIYELKKTKHLILNYLEGSGSQCTYC